MTTKPKRDPIRMLWNAFLDVRLRGTSDRHHPPVVSRKECGPGAADCSPGWINAVSVARNVVLGCRLVAINSVPAARLMQSWGPSIAVLYTYGELFSPVAA